MTAAPTPGAVELADRLAEREAMAGWGRPGAGLVRPYLGPDDIDTAAVVARHRIVTAAAAAHQPAAALPADDDSETPRPSRSLRPMAIAIVVSWVVVFGVMSLVHAVAAWLA